MAGHDDEARPVMVIKGKKKSALSNLLSIIRLMNLNVFFAGFSNEAGLFQISHAEIVSLPLLPAVKKLLLF